MCIITISREYGAGGHSIGRRVAEELGIELYDRDIIRNAVEKTGLDIDTIEKKEEEVSFFSNIWHMITPAAYVDQQQSIHDIERNAIIMFARKGPCVILGRCADAILEEAGIECLNVFIYADDIHRAVRVSQLIDSKDPSKIQRAMKHTDLARRGYYQKYSGRRWGECGNYNLALDSGVLGYDACVRIICEAARAMDERAGAEQG